MRICIHRALVQTGQPYDFRVPPWYRPNVRYSVERKKHFSPDMDLVEVFRVPFDLDDVFEDEVQRLRDAQ